jgi:aerobic carbon-monoxide dehydrogenase medium subunit
VIPAAFDYQRAGSVDEAIGLLTDNGEDAKLIAGGHSLLPLMKLRLAAPSMLIDIGRIADLSYVQGEGGEVRIGALTRHHDAANSDLLREQVPLLAHVAGQIGDPQVRHRGTGGERTIAADDFFTGFLETALAPDEVLTEIRVPAVPGTGWAFEKFNRRAQDWAIVGVAAVLTNGSGGPGVGLVNMGSQPLRAAGTEEALRSGSGAADAAARAAEGADPPSDLNATPEFRRHLAEVLTRRALETAGA